MIFWRQKGLEKLTASEQQRADRLRKQLKPTTQNTIRYTSLYENGLMHVGKNLYSKTYRLGDVSYATAQHEEKLNIIDTYAAAINSLDTDTKYQLLIVNRRIQNETLENVLYEEAVDDYDDYRLELNEIIKSRFKASSNNFEVFKYITLAQEALDRDQAYIQLEDMGKSLENEFKGADIDLVPLSGMERLQIFSDILRDMPNPNFDYRDLEITGLGTKSFIAPSRIQFFENRMKLNDGVAKVMHIRHYPSFMTDKLIRTLTTLGIELVISIQGQPYNTEEALTRINTAYATVTKEKIKHQLKGANQGVDGNLYTSSHTNDIAQAAEFWREEITEHDQKIYSGVITVFFKATDEDELKQFSDKLKTATRKLQVDLDDLYYYQEEALNSILPIGEIFLDVKRNFMRDMTTANLATQVPFTNVDLLSKSKRALYYGQNQLSHNIITLDRKNDLSTGSGVVLGSSGSGKGMTVKSTEVIPTLLKFPEDRIIIIDPEDEYSDIGRAFGAQMIDITIGSKTNINLLDLPDRSKLADEDDDLIGHKSNLLMGLYESVMDEVSDEQFGIIDRVTRLTYQYYEKPTLQEWQEVLRQQPEAEARQLALKSEIYATGSQNIFAYPTNVDLESNFIIFNLKKLSGKLKPFALMVLQDYIWNQVVENQGLLTTRLYWDEIQLSFKTAEQALFFTELWSRIRKYGAIATGITQNPETLTAMEEGRKLLSNSEFFILLKMKKQDIRELREIINLTDEQVRFIEKPKAKGSGLLVAEGVVVPFENPIPNHTKLYDLIATDA